MSLKTYKVLKIEKEKRKYIIHFDNNSYPVSDDFIVRKNIYKDKIFDENEFNDFLNEVNLENYYFKTLNYLSYKQRSRNEIINYLKELDVSNYEIILNKISFYIDDQKLAKNLLDLAISKLKGPNYYLLKLKERLLEVNSLYTLEIEETVIVEAFKKVKKAKENNPINKQKQLIINKLVYDGFNLNIILKTLKEEIFTFNNYDLLKNDYQKGLNKYKDNQDKLVRFLLNKGYDYKDIKEIMKKD